MTANINVLFCTDLYLPHLWPYLAFHLHLYPSCSVKVISLFSQCTEPLHSFSRLLFLIICTNLSVKIDVFHLKNQKDP